MSLVSGGYCSGKIRSDICPWTLSVPLSSQFSSSYTLGKLYACFSEQIKSADKYSSIFSRQMEAIVYISRDGQSGSIGPSLSPGRGLCVVFFDKTFNSHSAFLHPAVPANVMPGGTLPWNSILSMDRVGGGGREKKYSKVFHATKQDELRPDWKLGSYADFTF